MFTTVTPKLLGDSKAVVLMYGWFGAEKKHLEKYANIYVDLGCTVIYGTTKLINIMTRNEKGLHTFAMESVRIAAKTIRGQEEDKDNLIIPVVLHYFSNGGAFVADRLQQMIHVAKDVTERKTHARGTCGGDVEDLKFVAYRLQRGFEVLDSAPAYLHEEIFFVVIEVALQNLIVRVLAKMCLHCIVIGKKIYEKISGKPNDRDEFWHNVTHSDMCCRQLYLYSTRDKLTDYKMIDILVEERGGMGIQVLAKNFEDSEHVSHFREYPEEYKAFIAKVIDFVATHRSVRIVPKLSLQKW